MARDHSAAPRAWPRARLPHNGNGSAPPAPAHIAPLGKLSGPELGSPSGLSFPATLASGQAGTGADFPHQECERSSLDSPTNPDAIAHRETTLGACQPPKLALGGGADGSGVSVSRAPIGNLPHVRVGALPDRLRFAYPRHAALPAPPAGSSGVKRPPVESGYSDRRSVHRVELLSNSTYSGELGNDRENYPG